MNQLRRLLARRHELGLTDPKYAFLHAPFGFSMTERDKQELEEIGRRAHAFLARVNTWLPGQIRPGGGTWWGSILQKGLPAAYANVPYRPELSQTLMIDTVWTADGWRIVEIDTTNRNGLGFPLMLRDLYGLPNHWIGTASSWRRDGWTGATQIMAHRHRFYEPYFRRFLREVEGTLVTQDEVGAWLARRDDQTTLVDLPILHPMDETDRSVPELTDQLLASVESLSIAIPPKHQLSSKAVLTLPWELPAEFGDEPVKAFLPEAHLVCRNRALPSEAFFLKMLQSGGAKGTFVDDARRLMQLLPNRKPEAIWQKALPIRERMVRYLDHNGVEREEAFFIRFSVYVDREGTMVDADVTAARQHIVHGGRESVLTIPVLSS